MALCNQVRCNRRDPCDRCTSSALPCVRTRKLSRTRRRRPWLSAVAKYGSSNPLSTSAVPDLSIASLSQSTKEAALSRSGDGDSTHTPTSPARVQAIGLATSTRSEDRDSFPASSVDEGNAEELSELRRTPEGDSQVLPLASLSELSCSSTTNEPASPFRSPCVETNRRGPSGPVARLNQKQQTYVSVRHGTEPSRSPTAAGLAARAYITRELCSMHKTGTYKRDMLELTVETILRSESLDHTPFSGYDNFKDDHRALDDPSMHPSPEVMLFLSVGT